MQKSLYKRISATGRTLNDYSDYLKENQIEGNEFINSLQITFSEFFRNPLTFACLEQIVLPTLVAKKATNKDKELRIWSSACAEGQEPYSLAILWDEMNQITKTKIFFRIFATDINREALNRAKAGLYNRTTLKKVTLERIQAYFQPQGDQYIINPNLNEYINFSFFNLLTEECTCPPESIFGNFDIVLCSNVLFYFKPEFRYLIIEKLGYCLAPGGYLISSETERELLITNNYKEVFPNSAIFQKGG